MIKIPSPLALGDSIAVTAPSSGVAGAGLDRLDLVIDTLRDRGYKVVEGNCLRSEYKDASGSKAERADEFSQFLYAPNISAILPPWGGELATEILERINFKGLAGTRPKWLLGYSDLSTLQLPLTLISGWATAHGPNLMDLAPTQSDDLTRGALSVLEATWERPIVQHSSSHYQTEFTPYQEQVDAPFNLSRKTYWHLLNGLEQRVDFAGHLIGGCLDTISWLAGTAYGDVPGFVKRSGDAGVIMYLENAEMNPCSLVRCLRSLRRHKWFDELNGLLIGRNSGLEPTDKQRLGYIDALQMVLGDLEYPVLIDVDIGHMPPQMTLVNGAYAIVNFEESGGKLSQSAPNNSLHTDT